MKYLSFFIKLLEKIFLKGIDYYVNSLLYVREGFIRWPIDIFTKIVSKIKNPIALIIISVSLNLIAVIIILYSFYNLVYLYYKQMMLNIETNLPLNDNLSFKDKLNLSITIESIFSLLGRLFLIKYLIPIFSFLVLISTLINRHQKFNSKSNLKTKKNKALFLRPFDFDFMTNYDLPINGLKDQLQTIQKLLSGKNLEDTFMDKITGILSKKYNITSLSNVYGSMFTPRSNIYVSHNTYKWKVKINKLIEENKFTILFLDVSPGILFELETLYKKHSLNNTYLLFPPWENDTEYELWLKYKWEIIKQKIPSLEFTPSNNHVSIFCNELKLIKHIYREKIELNEYYKQITKL